MPLYDYQCKKCQAVFEVQATFKEKEAGLDQSARSATARRHINS